MPSAVAAQLFLKILESAPDAMLVTDGQGVIVLVNRRTEELFGYDRADLIGHKVEVLVPKGRRQEHAHDRVSFQAAPQPRPMGHRSGIEGRKMDGTVFPADVSLSPLPLEGDTFMVAAVRDLTMKLEREERHHRLLDRIRELEREVDLLKAGHPVCPHCGAVAPRVDSSMAPAGDWHRPGCSE